jgi:hypothetical protein
MVSRLSTRMWVMKVIPSNAAGFDLDLAFTAEFLAVLIKIISREKKQVYSYYHCKA